MKSMRLSDEEKKDMASPKPISEHEEYPYGLSIHIDDETFSKLEMKETPKVGDIVMVLSKCTVKEVRKEMNNEINNTSMTLQITDMELREEKEETDKATEFYGG